MRAVDIILLVIIGTAVFFVIKHIVKMKKHGCGHTCSSCGRHCLHRKEEKQDI